MKAANARLLLLLFFPITHTTADVFSPIGQLPNRAFGSGVSATSSDGSVAIGSVQLFENAISDKPDFTATIWEESSGFQILAPDLVPEVPVLFSDPYTTIWSLDISSDGQVATGAIRQNRTKTFPLSSEEAYRWTASQGVVKLDDPTGLQQYFAAGISGDGSTIVGGSRYQFSPSEGVAVAWIANQEPIILGDLPGGRTSASASAASHDGSIIVGTGTTNEGSEAFRWTQTNGFESLGEVPGGFYGSKANGISADGSTIVGSTSTEASGASQEAFRWTEVGGFELLGAIEEIDGQVQSFARKVSGDGAVVVGSTDVGDSESVAFVWHDSFGMLQLSEFLELHTTLADSFLGWDLGSINDISSDARVLAGTGINPDGLFEGWIIRLDQPIGIPEPSSLFLLYSASFFTLLFRLNSVNRSNAL